MSTPELSQSAKLYQERVEPAHRETRRQPNAHLDMAANAVHTMDMQPPYPTIDVLHATDDKPPDAGGTTPWPYGYTEEDIT